MTFVEVSKLPKRKYGKHSRHAVRKELDVFVTDFIESGMKYAKVVYDEDEYAAPNSCQNALASHIRRSKIGNVKATVIDYEVYLIRTDL